MCYACWTEEGQPKIVSEKTRRAASLIGEVYRHRGAGGNLHIVVDDWNHEEENVQWCLERILENTNNDPEEQIKAEKECAEFLLTLTDEERLSALAIHDKLLTRNSKKFTMKATFLNTQTGEDSVHNKPIDFARVLEESFKEPDGSGYHYETRMQFIAREVFDLTTYESDFDELIGREIFDVCMAITHKKTFDYIEDEECMAKYLRCVNMQFFKDRLDWGTSIRGAWWDHSGQVLKSCGLMDGPFQILKIDFTGDEWEAFMLTLEAFIEKENLP